MLGLGRSGIGAAKLLCSEGRKVIIIENSNGDKFEKISNELKNMGAEVNLLGEPLDFNNFTPWINDIDSVITSPGIPWDHNALKALRLKNIHVEGEMALAWKHLKHIPWIGITGTNGKTTVSKMLQHVLKNSFVKSDIGGNVGQPMSELAFNYRSLKAQEPSWLVVELSSFQIESASKVKPSIGIWTNLTPDHLERHGSIDAYSKIKRSLIEKSSTRIYNADDKYLLDHKSRLPNGIWVTTEKKIQLTNEINYWIDDKGIIFENERELFNSSILSIRGKHNLQNLLLVIAAARKIGIHEKFIAKGVASFKGVAHRLESIGKFESSEIFNDSKATNFQSSSIAIQSVPGPSILIAGGQAKEGDPTEWLAQINKNTCAIILFGSSAQKFQYLIQSSGYKYEVILTEFMEEALIKSFELAIRLNAKSILLSPACASFDQYISFEKRGEHFKGLVKDFLESKESKF